MVERVEWKGGLSFVGTAKAGYEVPLGAPARVGGSDDGFHPMELLGVGLAGCTGMDVISILQKKRQEVEQFEVLVHTQRDDDHPRVWTRVHIEYIISGRDIDPKAVERAIELSATKYCPAQHMFSKFIEITTNYEIVNLS